MAGNERTLVLIADDHAVLRAGLHLLQDAQPDMLAVGGAETAEQAASIRESLTHSPRKVARFS
jgi:DNA-binding NarL/FixJ family response regulator